MRSEAGGATTSSRPQLRGERLLVYAIAALAVLAPLAIAGGLPWVQVALSTMSLGVFVVGWAVVTRSEAGLRLPPLVGAFAIAVAATALQLVPLPRVLVGILSPHALAARADAGALPAFLPLTLDVPATALSLVKTLAATGLFVAAGSLAYRSRRARPILAAIAGAGALIATIALAQRASMSDKILWFYKPEWCTTFLGTFVNTDHACEFFGLSTCIALGFAGEGGRTRSLAIASALASGLGLAFTASRGGMLVFGLVGVVVLALALRRNFGKVAGAVVALVSVACAGAGAVILNEGVAHRFTQLDGKYLLHNQKVQGWLDALPMIRDYFVAGVGRGAYEAPFQAYRTVEDHVTITTPENFLVLLSSEWGVLVTLAVLGLAVWTARQHAHRLAKLGIVEWAAGLGVVGVVLQNLDSFGLEMPGVALPTAATLGVVVARMCAREKVERARLTRRGMTLVALGWAGALVLGAWAVGTELRADDAKLSAMLEAHASPSEIDAAASRAIERHPCDYHLELLDAIAHVRAGDATAMHHLNRVLRLRPKDIEAHRLAAVVLARAHHLGQAALEYRTAFVGGLPLSTKALAEVAEMLGPHSVDAVPQHPPELLGLAGEVARTRPALSETAALRAHALAPTDENVARQVLDLARASKDPARIARDVAALEPSATNTDEALALADAWREIKRPGDVERVLKKALVRHPDDPLVALAWARHLVDVGSFDAAHAALDGLLRRSPPLEVRRDAEHELAELAKAAGDDAGAVIHRANEHAWARSIETGGLVPQ